MSQSRKSRRLAARDAVEVKRLKLGIIAKAGEVVRLLAPHLPQDLVMQVLETIEDARDLVADS